MPAGFKVADEPAMLDKSLVEYVYNMRWEEIGWQLGKITDIITDATPRLFKSGFNFRIIWADKHKGPAKLAQ